MATIKIFMVFHRLLDERLILSSLSETEIERWFVPYGVNAKCRPKQVTYMSGLVDACASCTPRLILEHQLPEHVEELQERGFMETSCYVHVERNGLHRDTDLVGVCQYDMRWTEDAATLLRNLERAFDTPRVVFGIAVGSIMNAQRCMHALAFADRRNWAFLVESYNRFFGTSFGPDALIDKPLTLFQTYLLPTHEFSALARWLTILCAEVFPWAAQPPYETHWGSLGGFTERAESLFVALGIHEGRFTFEQLPLHHDPAIAAALGITKEHYALTRV